MPLSDTLLAIRGLVLETNKLPEDQTSRTNLIKQFAPGLTKDELADLVRIPIDKLQIYHSTIFSGEARVLKNHYKITLAYLEKNLPEFNLLQLVKDLHQTYPWKGNLTLDLIQNFNKYIKEISVENSIFLNEIAALELTSFLVKKDLTPKSDIISKKLDYNSLTIDQLLKINYRLNPTIKFQSFQYNLVKYYRDFYSNNQALTETPENFPCAAICCRTSSGRALWTEVAPSIFNFLQTNQSFPLASLAEVFIANQPPEEENLQFQKFYLFWQELLQRQIILPCNID